MARADSIIRAAETKKKLEVARTDSIIKANELKRRIELTKNDSIRKTNDAKRLAALARADSIIKALEMSRQKLSQKKIIDSESDFKVVLKLDTAKALEIKKQMDALRTDSSAHVTTIHGKSRKKKTDILSALHPEADLATELSVKQTIEFETTIKNINGAPFTNAPVMIKTSVLKDSTRGEVIFVEEHTAITNNIGIAKLQIGGGTLERGDFMSINWASGRYFIKTEANPTGVTKIDILDLPQSDSVSKKQNVQALVKSIFEVPPATDSSISKNDTLTSVGMIDSEEPQSSIGINIDNEQDVSDQKFSIPTQQTKWDDYRVKLYLQNEALTLNPNNAKAYIERGRIKTELEDYRGAMSDLNKAISIDSSNIEAYNARGLVKVNINNYSGALADFYKSISIDNQQSYAYALTGITYAYMKNFNVALSYLDTAINLSRDSAKYYAYRGTCKYNINDFRGALNDYNTAIKLGSSDYLTYYNRANAKNQMRDYIDAIDDYNKAISLAPSFAKAYYKRGNAKSDLRDIRGSIIDYEKAIVLDPENAKAYYNAGVMKTKLKDFESAILYFNRAIELAPNWASAYYNRGVSKLTIERIEQGCIDLSIAGEKGYSKAYDIIKRRCNK